jgi:hypothetical protein
MARRHGCEEDVQALREEPERPGYSKKYFKKTSIAWHTAHTHADAAAHQYLIIVLTDSKPFAFHSYFENVGE